MKKVPSAVLALTLCLGLLPTAHAAGVNPAPSHNIYGQQYTNVQRWSQTVKSHLFVNPSGGLTRVEYIKDKVVIEDYDGQFQLQASRTIPMELPIWGGL